MCVWCEDLRNVEPAKYISFSSGEDPEWLQSAKKRKAFLHLQKDKDEIIFYEMVKCPYCGQQFEGNEELYDEYD